MIGGLQGENRDLNNKYMKKKSKRVGRKYLEALRWILQACKMGCEISQAEGLYFISKGWFRSDHLVISKPKADFAAAKLAFKLVWLASNGNNSFISTPIHAPFEALDSCFPSFETTYSIDYYQKVLFCRPNYNGFKHLCVVIIFI